MIEDLIKLPTGKLLNDFGGGSHKPGSGSAAALSGLLSTQLIRTVIKITLGKNSYKKFHVEFKKIKSDVEERIYPRLLELLQEDSVQFDIAIRKRKERDKEKDPNKWSRLNFEAQESLKITTEIPLEIGNLCLELASFAGIIFDNGFKSARGDSGVALSNAIAATVGCLSIIDLNLWCYEASNEWTKEVRGRVEELREECHLIDIDSKLRMIELKEEAERRDAYYKDINGILASTDDGAVLTYDKIEGIANDLQAVLLNYGDTIRKKNAPKDEMDVLNPEEAIRRIGYNYHEIDSLGEHVSQGDRWKIAGIIDQEDQIVSISKDYPPHTMRFTAAHELGHALLHKNMGVLYRDRPIDGASPILYDKVESEANKFAACFLMPSVQVKRVFSEYFGFEKFAINEDTAFLLSKSISGLRKECKDLRELTYMLAKVESYDRKNFNSLAKVFKVSPTTMAIRLEEIGLVEYS